MISIIFENDQVLLVDKPHGVTTVPTRMGESDPRPCLGIELEKERGIRLFPVHRLDTDVTGLVLFAKTPDAHRLLNRFFEEKTIHKRYSALTEGKATGPARATWRSILLRGKKRSYESPHGKEAITRAELLGQRGPYLEWELEPVTGRPHQLRYELAKHGHPIIGDALYGSQVVFEKGGIALRAFKLDLPDEVKVLNMPNAFEIDRL